MEPFELFRLVWLLFGAMTVAVFSFWGKMAHAYIPRARVVMEKVAKHHGKGIYQIQQEITFRDDRGPLTLTEDWTIENGDNMYVEVKGAGQSAVYLFKGKQKHFIDEQGAERTASLSDDFFESVFHNRGWDGVADFLVKEKIITSKNLVRETYRKDLKDSGYIQDPLVRLSRTAGTIALAIGRPSPTDSGKALPGIWVEQDRFLIRRIRFDTQAEVSADDYAEYSGNLWFPKLRTVSWGDKTVQIRTVKVSAVSAAESVRQKLNPAIIKAKKSEGTKRVITSQTIADFYERFR